MKKSHDRSRLGSLRSVNSISTWLNKWSNNVYLIVEVIFGEIKSEREYRKEQFPNIKNPMAVIRVRYSRSSLISGNLLVIKDCSFEAR